MNIEIRKAKNGEDTAAADNMLLHSSYAPSREAERFVQNLTFPFIPEIIILIEPALSYSAKIIKEKFPHSKLGVVRFNSIFNQYNSIFDFSFNYSENSSFENWLENNFTEEALMQIMFIEWEPSAKAFTPQITKLRKEITAALERAKTLLITRQYFEKKWFYNSALFFRWIKHPLYLNNKINKDTVIISSGPSLKNAIPVIKQNRNHFFVLCLSSAISACLKNGITPDLCMSTDGGFWAGEHLKKLNNSDIPLALAVEGHCSKSILSHNKILPLVYDDGISLELSNASDLKMTHSVRNGTVSGTALLFAAEHCTKDIFLCGLDMACQKGFQHFQPNELENNNSPFDNRLRTKEKRLTASQFSSSSLEVYKNWFIQNPLDLKNRKVYRVIENSQKKNSLGWIKDIEPKEFDEHLKNQINQNENNKTKDFEFIIQDNKTAFEKVIDYIKNNSQKAVWKKYLFPLDYTALSHNPDHTALSEKIEKEYTKLINKILDI